MKKYEITNETIYIYGKTFYRIKSLINFGNVTQGTLGGFIEKETNLSHDGNAWVFDNAIVCGDASVYGNARVFGNAKVFGNAMVYGNAWVSSNAKVFGNAWVCSNAKVYGNAMVYGDAWVFDNAIVCGDAWVCSNAWVYGDAKLCGNAWVFDNADYLCFTGLGSRNRNITFFKCRDGYICVSCDGFHGNLVEFENRVRETYGNTKYAKEYLACVTVVKIHFGIE